jgi:hypothetical protein
MTEPIDWGKGCLGCLTLFMGPACATLRLLSRFSHTSFPPQPKTRHVLQCVCNPARSDARPYNI